MESTKAPAVPTRCRSRSDMRVIDLPAPATMLLLCAHILAAAAAPSLTIEPAYADASGGALITLTSAVSFSSPVHAESKCVFGSQQV